VFDGANWGGNSCEDWASWVSGWPWMGKKAWGAVVEDSRGGRDETEGDKRAL